MAVLFSIWIYNYISISIQNNPLFYHNISLSPHTKNTLRLKITNALSYIQNNFPKSHLCLVEAWTIEHSKNVFREPQKICMHPSTLYSFFKRNLKKLNLPQKLKIHSIRHTVATTLIENNVPISDIQALGGWSTPRVLLDTYVHANNKNQKNLIDSLSKLTSQ